MKNLLLLLSILLLFSFKSKDKVITNPKIIKRSSQVINTILYKGTLNTTTVIWLYINEQEQPCGGDRTIINAMYKYENQKKWLLLDVTADQQKKNYCMVEDNFTGVLLLENKGDSFIGNWISPNAKKQFKVELQKVELDIKTNEKLEETLFDVLIYGRDDC